jgi:hypothetical protein
LSRTRREADERVHGSTHERSIDHFAREEASSLRLLPARPIPSRHQRFERRVANDRFVDVDTVRYSVPYRLLREAALDQRVYDIGVPSRDRPAVTDCRRATLTGDSLRARAAGDGTANSV